MGFGVLRIKLERCVELIFSLIEFLGGKVILSERSMSVRTSVLRNFAEQQTRGKIALKVVNLFSFATALRRVTKIGKSCLCRPLVLISQPKRNQALVNL